MLNSASPALKYATCRRSAVPRHLVHPEHGKRDTWDVRGEAVCPTTCKTMWRSRRNTF